MTDEGLGPEVWHGGLQHVQWCAVVPRGKLFGPADGCGTARPRPPSRPAPLSAR
jgi:hypothetical protein